MYNFLQTRPYFPHPPDLGNHFPTLFLSSNFFF